MKLESNHLELHVHTLQEQPKDATEYEHWRVATEDLEESAKGMIASSKVMREKMKKTQEQSDVKVKKHDSEVFAALLKRTDECVLREPAPPLVTLFLM